MLTYLRGVYERKSFVVDFGLNLYSISRTNDRELNSCLELSSTYIFISIKLHAEYISYGCRNNCFPFHKLKRISQQPEKRPPCVIDFFIRVYARVKTFYFWRSPNLLLRITLPILKHIVDSQQREGVLRALYT